MAGIARITRAASARGHTEEDGGCSTLLAVTVLPNPSVYTTLVTDPVWSRWNVSATCCTSVKIVFYRVAQEALNNIFED